jgi:membrane-anchored mycosin MYCP
MTGTVVAHGTDIVTHGTANSDCAGRGTALAALIAARPVDGSALTGVAPATRILPIRVLTKQGNVPPAALAKGIRAAVDGGAQVVLVGGGTAPNADLRDAVASAAAHNVLVVASVGTAGGDGGTAALYPATDPSVLAVGGLDHTGAPTESVSARVDLSAPAENVVTEGPSGVGNYSINGAPAAAAYVAGAAALVRSYWPRLTAGQVRDRLIATATPLVGFTGHRELDVYSAVTSTNAERPVESGPRAAAWPVVPPRPGVPDGTRIAAIVTSCAAAFTAAGFIAVHGMRVRRHRLDRQRQAEPAVLTAASVGP